MRALLFTAIAVGTIAIAVPAQAREGLTVMGESQREFTETVRYGDLNLSERSGANTLRHRVVAAAGRVCADAHGAENMGGRLVAGCTSGTYRDAKPAIEQAIAMVQSGKQLAASSILIRVAMR